MCKQADETVNHLLSECSKMAQKEFKRRHDWVGKKIHWEACLKYGFDVKSKWYENEPVTTMEKDVCTILWDFNIQTDHVIQVRRLDLVIKEKSEEWMPDSGLRNSIRQSSWNKRIGKAREIPRSGQGT